MAPVLLSVGGVKTLSKKEAPLQRKELPKHHQRKISADGEKYSIVFPVCIFLCGVCFRGEARWANVCGIDLLKGQQASATSKERVPRNRSGNTIADSEYFQLICHLFLVCNFVCGGFLSKLSGQMCVVCIFKRRTKLPTWLFSKEVI